MTSFQIAISPSRRAAARFVARVRRALQTAVVEEGERNGITQSEIARSIGVHRSVISRELNGRQDITLGRIAELAWAMGREIEFDLVEPKVAEGSNVPTVRAGALPVESRSQVSPETRVIDRQIYVTTSNNAQIMELTA
jgi:transcriptional regulator with XRE-family HTH domain